MAVDRKKRGRGIVFGSRMPGAVPTIRHNSVVARWNDLAAGDRRHGFDGVGRSAVRKSPDTPIDKCDYD